MYLLGYDIGSSSVKASIVEAGSGRVIASAFYPESEAPIIARQPGWAEQDPELWFLNLKLATAKVLEIAGRAGNDGKTAGNDGKTAGRKIAGRAGNDVEIAAIGISYQMHGLVCVDRDMKVLRPSIIWCDSRAVSYGKRAFEALGEEWCLQHLLNSPGNFTAAKLAWVKENEPELFSRIHKIMLPGDYIALRLTGSARTTVSGLSEGIFWDFRENAPSRELMEHFGFDESLLPELAPTFGIQGTLTRSAAEELGLREGTPVTYRAGDQPNNALSLGVLQPGEIASTAGTSGVVYGVIGDVAFDPQSRVNTFAHVNHTAADPRLGVLLCINGTGILNSWMRRTVAPEGLGYAGMNELAATAPIGSDGVCILPFGNGAERMLGNRDTGCSVHGVNFNRHGKAHLLRAAQEGIVFSFRYGIGIMEQMGLKINTIHAGNANMFLSPVFRETLAGVTGAVIELHDTDGAAGAARGAGLGAGIYKTPAEAFSTLERIAVIEPTNCERYNEAYDNWKSHLSF